MTLIECFTQSHIDNMVACLHLRPERMVMIGNVSQMATPIKRYEKLLEKRKIPTKITPCNVENMDLDDMYAALRKVVLEAKDCVIDLTGGEECVIMAAGAVLAQLPADVRQNVRVEKYDHNANMAMDCAHDYQKIPTKTVDLTVEELIGLYGGKPYPGSYQLDKDIRPSVLDGLWNIASQDPTLWNDAIKYLCEFESKSKPKMQLDLCVEDLRNSISNFETKEKVVRDLLAKLDQCGVIVDQSSDDDLKYTYTSSLSRYCTQKAGNVLEVKTLLQGRAVLEKGAPYFSDCRMSVSIGWDKKIDEPPQKTTETRNEIDVIFMHGTTPLFVSCKNGNVDEELYKLHTVAERFGGSYVKKMLIVTDLDGKKPAAKRALRQRAWNMDVFLVTDAAELSPEEWRDIFKEAMQ